MKNKSLLFYYLLALSLPSIAMEIALINTTEPSQATQLCIHGMDTKNRSLVKNGIRMGADVNYTHPHPAGLNFIQRACDVDDWRMVAYLLDTPDIQSNAYQKNTSPAFHWAVTKKNKNSITLLLDHAPETINIQDSDGNTILHLMCQINNKKMVKLLLSKKNINPNLYNNAQETPLHTACAHGATSCIKSLISYNTVDTVNFIAQNDNGELPFERACYSGKIQSVKPLLPFYKKTINSQDYFGYTALHTACLNGQSKISKILLRNKANPTIRSNHQRTPLAIAYFEYSDFNTFYSAKLKKLVLQKDTHGNTQLHLSTLIHDTRNKLDDYLLFLITNGLNIGERNKDKKRPVDLACEKYTTVYNQYMAEKMDYFYEIVKQQEEVMHTFLRATSCRIQCALFTYLLQQKDIYKYSLPKELLIYIARMYYMLNIETIIAKQYMHKDYYYDTFIENKNKHKQRLFKNPEHPHLLWG